MDRQAWTDERLRWVQEHPGAGVFAGVIGVASGFFAGLGLDYPAWAAIGTAFGMFGLTLRLAKDFLSDDET